MTESIEQLKKQASEHLDTGNYSGAVDLYLKVLESEPENQEICLVLGSVYGEMGNFDDASTLVSKAIALNPDDSTAHLAMGHILRGQGEKHQALESFRKSVDCSPDDAEALCTYGSMLHEIGQLDDAVACFEKATKSDPDSAEAWVMYGSLCFKQGNLESAANAYGSALKLKPDDIDTAVALSRALSMLERGSEAESVLRRTIDDNRDDPKLHYQMALNLLQQGRHGEALESSQKTLDLDQGNADYIILRAHIYERMGNAEESFALLKPLLEEEEVKVDAALAFARLSPVLGMKDQARTLLDKVSTYSLSDRQRESVDQARVELGPES